MRLRRRGFAGFRGGAVRRAVRARLGLGCALAQARRLANPLAEVVELRPPRVAGAFHLDLGDLRRVERKDALDPFALNDAANRKRLASPVALSGDDHAVK